MQEAQIDARAAFQAGIFERTAVNLGLGKRPAPQADNLIALGDFAAPPLPAASEQLKLRNLVGQPGQHLDIVVARYAR